MRSDDAPFVSLSTNDSAPAPAHPANQDPLAWIGEQISGAYTAVVKGIEDVGRWLGGNRVPLPPKPPTEEDPGEVPGDEPPRVVPNGPSAFWSVDGMTSVPGYNEAAGGPSVIRTEIASMRLQLEVPRGYEFAADVPETMRVRVATASEIQAYKRFTASNLDRRARLFSAKAQADFEVARLSGALDEPRRELEQVDLRGPVDSTELAFSAHRRGMQRLKGVVETLESGRRAAIRRAEQAAEAERVGNRVFVVFAPEIPIRRVPTGRVNGDFF